MRISRTLPAFVFSLCCTTTLFAQQGTLYERTLLHESTERTYQLYVPTGYTDQADWPLVISFHGYGIDGDFQRQIDRFDLASDASGQGFLIAYPNGLIVDDPFDGPGIGWNFDGRVADHDDFAFTSELIDHISEDYRIDPSRVHATGWSMGAGMVWGLSCRLADRIASFAAVGGVFDREFADSCTYSRPVSSLLIHGTEDSFVPPEGKEVNGYVFTSPDFTAGFWAFRSSWDGNVCLYETMETPLEDVSTSDGSTVTRADYDLCNDETEVLYYKVNGGGHTWPSGSWPPDRNNGNWPSFLGNVNRDLDASAEILHFFARNPLPGTGTAVEAERPDATELLTTFPNPFYDKATVSVQLDHTGPVRLEVFDLVGRRVAVLLEGTFSASSRTARLEASNWAAGLYLIRLQTPSGTQTQKVVLAR